MRRTQLINHNWKFVKENIGAEAAASANGIGIDLPHTWNAIDGQDGGNDYYRGTCFYVKEFDKPEINEKEQVYLEFRGVSSSADVYMNGKHLGHHDGGYSTFRVNISEALDNKNTLVVEVDNAPNRRVYPQKADFTFYGGIYRDVYLLVLPEEHFTVDYYGTPGISVTPVMEETKAKVKVQAFVQKGETVRFTIDGEGSREVSVINGIAQTEFIIENAHLWDGVKDPYLYFAKAELLSGGLVVDEIHSRFGCRTYYFDSEKGFFLNGRAYPLRGVSRHQDRRGVGNALTKEMHDEDIALIREVGANTIRLAHYQHDQYFYDRCDEEGFILWAEIPYITQHMPEGRENTISQMKELIVQNYNHPSIICWGLSNEITTTGGVTEDLIQNHRVLNDLCHKMDSTRPTTMAHVFILDPEDSLVDLPDISSYNLYFGWYVGETNDNDTWFDEFHTKFPKRIIGLSEYGADASHLLHDPKPEKSDYTEEYQANYHEHMLKMISERPYIWSSHCWNMFDFAADGRDEANDKGVNHKGLVSFDRKVKKDAFFIYKAYLSEDPFVHLCGSRYVDRIEEVTEIKVYSNLKKIHLYCDGKLIAEQEGDKIFKFLLPISGVHRIEAKSESYSDIIQIRKVDQPNPSYQLAERAIVNWFDADICPEGYFSIKDKIGEISATPEGAAVMKELHELSKKSRGDVAQEVPDSPMIQKMVDNMPVAELLKRIGSVVNPEFVAKLNKALNNIKKPE